MALNKPKSCISSQVVDMAAPIGGAATEGKFSHVFSTMAIQALPDPAGNGTLDKWAQLLAPDGLVAIAIWDINEECGPDEIWAKAAVAVDPTYVYSPFIPPSHWKGRKELHEGLLQAGFRDVKSEVLELGFNVGKEGFMKYFWESGNPSAAGRQARFKGDLGKVKIEMERILDEGYEGGKTISLSATLAVGRRPLEV